MSLTYINGDGGSLPSAGAAATSSQLLADFNALGTEDRAAFLQAIAPAHHVLSGEAVTSGAPSAIPGDTAHDEEDTGPLWRLNLPAPLANTAWTDIVSSASAPVNVEAPAALPPLESGGSTPGGTTGGRLAAVWDNMSRAQRAAFLLAIVPAFSNAANQTARLALTNRKPGDYCRQSDGGLYRLRQLPAGTDGNWDLLHPF